MDIQALCISPIFRSFWSILSIKKLFLVYRLYTSFSKINPMYFIFKNFLVVHCLYIEIQLNLWPVPCTTRLWTCLFVCALHWSPILILLNYSVEHLNISYYLPYSQPPYWSHAWCSLSCFSCPHHEGQAHPKLITGSLLWHSIISA